MKLCRKCSVSYDDPELKFCSKCGTTLEEVNICPKCHTENELDFVFCVKCGTKLNGSSAKITASDRVLSPSITTAPITPIKMNEKPKEYTSSVNNYQYNTSRRDTQNDGIFGNPTVLIMMIVLAIVGLTILAMK